MANAPGTAFNPKTNLVYARAITASQVNAVTPAGFVKGGTTALVWNSGGVAVMFQAYLNANGAPTLVFPLDGAPPTGQPGTLIPPGMFVTVQIPAFADSFAAIGQSAGPTTIYVQRGEGL